MSNNELPDLSTWHRVPVGATIPRGVPHAYVVYGDCLAVELDGSPCDKRVGVNAHYTEHPIAPPLPTKEGATIAASSDNLPPRILLTREDGRWVNRFGEEWHDALIRSWAPVSIGETVVMP